MSPPARVGVVISWVDTHGRSVALAEALGLEAVFMPWARPRLPKARTIVGWLRSALRTVTTCRRAPDGALVLVQVPPVFAALTAVLAGRGRTVVLDLHSGALNDPKWRMTHGLLRWSMRRCAAVIVTTSELVADVDVGDVPVFELHDPLVDRRERRAEFPSGDPYVVFPAGGASDEPIDALVDAAAELAGRIEVRVTGRVVERLAGTAAKATGFLPEAEYTELLAGAAAVLALTTREATMQRTAYEALERGVPIVASDTSALRGALGGAAVFVHPDGASIAAGVREAIARSDELRAAGARRLADLRATSEGVFAQLLALPSGSPTG